MRHPQKVVPAGREEAATQAVQGHLTAGGSCEGGPEPFILRVFCQWTRSLLPVRTSGFLDNKKWRYFFISFIPEKSHRGPMRQSYEMSDGSSPPPVVRPRCCGCQAVKISLGRPNCLSISGSEVDVCKDL